MSIVEQYFMQDPRGRYWSIHCWRGNRKTTVTEILAKTSGETGQTTLSDLSVDAFAKATLTTRTVMSVLLHFDCKGCPFRRWFIPFHVLRDFTPQKHEHFGWPVSAWKRCKWISIDFRVWKTPSSRILYQLWVFSSPTPSDTMSDRRPTTRLSINFL